MGKMAGTLKATSEERSRMYDQPKDKSKKLEDEEFVPRDVAETLIGKGLTLGTGKPRSPTKQKGPW